MAGSQISTSVSIIDSLSGFMALSLTEYNTSAAAAIAAGSKVEIAGAFFQFPSDETPTGWAAIVTATTAYIALTASGTAGSQVVNAGYVSTAPTWRDDLQGWYASAASSVRIVASVYKAESTSYYPKSILQPRNADYRHSGKHIFISSGAFIVSPDINTVYITGCAAGGNGGTAVKTGATVGYGGGGGGGGESVIQKPITVTPASIVQVVIGDPGSNTSFGSFTLNCGGHGGNASAGAAGVAGIPGAFINGSFAGASGGAASVNGDSTEFASGGSSGATGGYTGAGGGGGAGLGYRASYLPSISGTSGAGAGGSGGANGGGGGGGGYGFGATNGGNGGKGGYGGGGGGAGGTGASGASVIGSPGSGGSAILIVEW